MTMKNRWKMNRMGFVNFWLYDEEIFEFCDGKILLRGQNGAGKSIATQSFIPFILDGDRTPRRLDPFGSSDRRMEYYFLGDGEKEESTGYLFLEFKKEETGQYRTVCIGQRAQKGKPMSFWGFVLMDGRRIGGDVQLYQQVGSAKIPYSKQDMKKVLGDDVPFTDVQGEYKAMVNKYLFGFPRMDQYEQYIQLLVKVRAPKLSKEFKPKKVYEILNESLQTLTDEDLRAMVVAMEKMDSIQGNLEDLRNAQKNTQIIQNEYTRYNQYMLAKKGEAYLQAKARAEEGQEKIASLQRQMETLQKEETEKEQNLLDAEEKYHLNHVELDSLKDLQLESAAEKKGKAEKELEAAKVEVANLDRKIEDARSRIREYEYNLKDISQSMDLHETRLKERREELEELQETVLFSAHDLVIEQIKSGKKNPVDEVGPVLKEYTQNLAAGIRLLREQATCDERYDEALRRQEQVMQEKSLLESDLESAQEDEQQCREQLIETYFQQSRRNQEFKLKTEQLTDIERIITKYENESDTEKVKKILEACRDRIHTVLMNEQLQRKSEENAAAAELNEKRSQLQELMARPEVEPVRKERTDGVRRRLAESGIVCVPFFKAVEFASGLSDSEQNLLEAQLADAGLLDSLVVSEKDWMRIQSEFTDVQDVFLRVRGKGAKPFAGLTVNSELPAQLKKETEKILCHIRTMSESLLSGDDGEEFLLLDESGVFRNGVLCGVSCEEDAEGFIGVLARKRKREQMELKLKEEIRDLQLRYENLQGEIMQLQQRMVKLEEEYGNLPDFGQLRAALELVRQILWNLEQKEGDLQNAEQEVQRRLQEKTESFQKVLAVCRKLPYNRSLETYLDAQDCMEEYRSTWESCRDTLNQLEMFHARETGERQKIDREEDLLDDFYDRQRLEERKRKSLEIQIRELDEYLDQPENREKAKRLMKLKSEQDVLQEKINQLKIDLGVLANSLIRVEAEKEERAERLIEVIERETHLRGYFEEELALKLVISRESRTTAECAQAAQEKLRDSDKNREASDITATLMNVFQKNNGSLTSYGAALGDCFGEQEALPGALRKRLVFTAVWNGKKVWMEEFHETLKLRIEETELLIQQKDRELFEDILSRTLSQQLTDRIAESRRWVNTMSDLMQGMDTSMGLSFALDWRPRMAENDQQIDTSELEKLLLRDRKLMTPEDMERVASHFRSKIREEKLRAEESGDPVNYMDLVRDALDYRKWFEFQMSYYRGGNGKKPLTDSVFNKFSGGEKAMAMYVPLLAAVNAQYQKASKADHPRIVAMDEAFAGVDDKNISSMFELVQQLDFDYIMNSQSLWGCFETVPALRISEMHRPANSQVVTIIHYTWNGRERVLDD